MAYTKTEQTVQNAKEDAGVVDSAIIESDEPIVIVWGEMINGSDVVGEAEHFAAVSIDRELDEDEQAVYQQDRATFSSVLIANEDGEASNDQLLSVDGGDVDDAVEALEMVTVDGRIDFIEANNENFIVEDGDVVRMSDVDVEDIDVDTEGDSSAETAGEE